MFVNQKVKSKHSIENFIIHIENRKDSDRIYCQETTVFGKNDATNFEFCVGARQILI